MKRTLTILLSLIMVFSIIPMAVANATENFETEDNDTFGTANKLALNSSITGNVPYYSYNNYDIDYYKITTTANGKLELAFHHEWVNDGSTYWEVIVYKYENGQYKNEVDSTSIEGDDDQKVVILTLGAVKGGEYYIYVGPNFDHSSGKNYTISNKFTATEYYEKEFNNDFDTATNMSLDKSYSGNNDKGYYNYDLDYYKTTTTANGKLELAFHHEWVNDGSTYWEVIVYKYENGQYDNKMIETSIDGNDDQKVVFLTLGAVKGGEYYICVNGNRNSSGINYTISNKFTATEYYEKEFNGDYDIATNMKIGKKYSGNLKTSSDVDIYKLDITKSGNVRIDFTYKYIEYNYSVWNVALYRYSNNKYTEVYTGYAIGKNALLRFWNGALSKGIYYLKVSDGCYYDYSTAAEYSISAKYFVKNPSKPSKISASVKKAKATVKWSKVSGIKGYQFQISKKSNFKKTVVNKELTKCSYAKKLSRKTKYFARVRSYKVVNGKTYYSGWKKTSFKTK